MARHIRPTMYTKTGKQRSYLRSLAHGLKPVVQVGQRGLTEGVLGQIDAQLEHHELIKVRISVEGADATAEAKAALEAPGDEEHPGLRAEVVQKVGHVLVLYRPRREKLRCVQSPGGRWRP